MTDPSPIIFFDDGAGDLAPLRDLRPVFDTRTGALTARQRLERSLGARAAALFVPPELEPLVPTDLPVNTVPDMDSSVLVVNGRCPLPHPAIGNLGEGQAAIEKASGDLIAARVSPGDARAMLAEDRPGLGGTTLDEIVLDEHVLMTRPWHARTFRDASIDTDLALLAAELPATDPTGCCLIGTQPVRAAPDATIFPASVFDTTHGPIAIGAGATIRPGATVIGPAWIGPGSTVLDKALVKPHTALGPVCKVAGEIGGTVIQGYSNKGHDGHLGDSWLGEWVNLGAGTTNSNLLNTYGEITSVATPGGSRERTGQTFFGCVLADHVKTAICTRVMTGAIVHTGTMWAATAPVTGCVGRFTWATDAGQHPYRADKFLDVMRTSMARRKIEPSEAYTSRIRALADL